MISPERLRVLIIDDSPDDALLITNAITGQELEITSERVDDASSLRTALTDGQWDVVISDYSMPSLTTAEALRIVTEVDANLPFIVVSGVIGEDAAVEMMRTGALDYVMKDRLSRLLPAIRREMREVKARKARVAAEADRNDLRQRLQTTVERAPVGIVNVAEDGRFLHVNQRFCEIVGYESAELLQLTFADITHPLDVNRDREHMRRMSRGELREYQTEKRYVRKDGEVVYVSLNTAPIYGPGGEFLYFASIMLDLTERKRMETQLRERDERYRQIVDNAQEGIWTIDTDGRTTFVNRSMADMLGYSADEMLGRQLHDFIHEADDERANTLADRRRLGFSDRGEFVLRSSSGESVRIHFTANRLLDADGAHIGALVMVTDVTARWDAEEAVLLQKRELDEAQRIAELGSWRRNLPGDAIVWSDGMYRILGVDPTANPNPRFALLFSLVEPEDREKVKAALANSIESGLPLDVHYRIRRPDGVVRSLHAFGEVTLDATGAPAHIRGVTQDVTERLESLAAHETLNREVQLLLESTTQGIFGVDRDGYCTFINRAASDALGYPPGQLVGRSMHDVTHQGPDCSHTSDGCPLEAAARTGTAIEVQADRLSRRDGSSLPVEYSAAPVIDGGAVRGAVVVFTDISERKLLQAQLEQSDRVSSLGRLAATMAHEFNNVLMGIQPFAETLSRHNPDQKVQRATQNILQAVQRGRSITHGILRFARPADLVKETIDVAVWLRSMDAALTALVGDRIRFQLRVDGDHLFIRGDRHQLEQVLTNLAANARDAMEDGGTLTVGVERCLSGHVFSFGAIRTIDRYLHITVTDTGSGMDAKTLKGIFDPFFTTKRSGTGLGLAVVHQVMQQHGGSIVAESTPGEGTVFHLFLPFSEESIAEAEVAPRQLSRTAIGSVLIVEDDEAISDGVAELLRDEGIAVEVAASGAAAMASLALHVPAVVILDVGLPDIDGRLLYERIALTCPELAVVFASGSNDEEMLRPYLRPGHIASLTKPYEFEALLQVLDSLDTPSSTAMASRQPS